MLAMNEKPRFLPVFPPSRPYFIEVLGYDDELHKIIKSLRKFRPDVNVNFVLLLPDNCTYTKIFIFRSKRVDLKGDVTRKRNVISTRKPFSPSARKSVKL